MNCIYHPQMPAAAYCGQCSRGLCPNCIYDPETDDRSVLCFNHVKASVDHDYSVAMNENTVAMAFRSVIAALAGLGFFSNAVSQGYSGQGFGVGILLAILVFIGTWGLYWGFKKWRAAGRPFFFFWTWGGGPIESAGATFAEIGRECGCDWRTVRKYLAESMAKSSSRCKMTVIGAPKLGILRRSPNLLFLLKSAVTSRYVQQVSPRWIVLIVALFVAACVLHAPSIGNLMCRNHTISRLMRGLIIHGCGFILGSRDALFGFQHGSWAASG